MKKEGILNAELTYLVSRMGHTDGMTICDSGFPISAEQKRIDLALRRGIPKFIEVLESVLDELVVEQVLLASEMREESPRLHQEIIDLLGDITINYCTHEEFKKRSKTVKGIVRSGEVIPYANIILFSGVNF